MDNACEKIADLIAQSKHTVVLTGAGISTLSGIADFRSNTDGIFQKKFRGMNLELVHDLAHFMKHPEDFYDYARTFHYRFHEKKPNIVHTTLARWQQQGVIGTIYTQNIDMLHQLGGAKDVVEFHGTMAMHHCLKCHKPYTYEDMLAILKNPEVPRCSCGGLIKPDVVFFGEGLDMDLFDTAIADMRKADLMLVLGSSLTVHPVATLPMETYYAGGQLVIINQQSTPLDKLAVVRYDDLLSAFEFLNTRIP